MRIVVLCTKDDRGLPSEDNSNVAREVSQTLRALGHRVRTVPMTQPPPRLSCDLVFNLCEGIDGEAAKEATVAAWLELMGWAYTGNGPDALRAALDKAYVPGPAPRRVVVENAFFRWRRQVKLPAIIKPRRADASLGIERASVVASVRQLRKRVNYVTRTFGPGAIVEEFIDGREFNVAVLDQDVLAISEIDFSRLSKDAPRIVTYRGKWDPESEEYRGTVPVCPARVSRALAARIGRLALEAIRGLGCRDYARVDLRMNSRGRLFVLEVNPNPDLARDAGFARCARAAGWSYEDLIGRLVAGAMERYEDRQARSVAPLRRRADGSGVRCLHRTGSLGLSRNRGHRSLKTGAERL